MHIAATAAVIAVVAMTPAGCGTDSSSSSPPQTATKAPAEATTAGPARTAAKPTTTAVARATTTSAGGSGAKTVPRHLVAQPLDVTERTLRDAGFSYNVIRLHNHASGAPSGWGVCETQPAPGERVSSARVDLIVVHSKCGAR